VLRYFGYLLIVLGFLGGAFFASLDSEEVNWPHFLIALAPGAVGVLVARFAVHRESRSPEKQKLGIERVGAGLRTALDEAETLWQDRENFEVGELRVQIDERFIDPINTFVEAREAMIGAFGLQGYADVMSEFAAGERYLNRVWSASTDGYVDEAYAYLAQSKQQFERALALFDRLSETSAVDRSATS
jgi:hypothetical protein